MTSLDKVLEAARASDPGDRILFRDAIVAHGELAIDPMTEWLGDPRLAAFAVRVLEFIGREPAVRDAVVEVLESADRADVSAGVAADVDAALARLGPSRPRGVRGGGRPRVRPVPSPGASGRGYWVMRTSQAERAYVWAEARRGRLRQGWGWNDEMNLDRIAERVRLGVELNDIERAAWRSRRMRVGTGGAMQLSDLVVAPNLPNWGQLSVFRIVGSYNWSMDAPRKWDERFGHVLPVELLVSGVDRRAPQVSDTLRAVTRLQPRLWSITPYGGEVERLVEQRASPRSAT
jgi:hypothetical protein